MALAVVAMTPQRAARIAVDRAMSPAIPDVLHDLCVDAAEMRTAKWTDAIVIAPDHRIAAAVAGLRPLGCPIRNVPAAVSDRCADKLGLAERIAAAGIRTPKTRSFRAGLLAKGYLVKPRYGFGTQVMRVGPSDVTGIAPTSDSQLIEQPIEIGEHLSIVVLCTSDGRTVLPVVQKSLAGPSADPDRFCVERATVSGFDPDVEAFAGRVLDAIADTGERLDGPLGLDLVRTPTGDLSLIEVNPRVTSSLAGYVLAGGPPPQLGWDGSATPGAYGTPFSFTPCDLVAAMSRRAGRGRDAR